MIAGNCYCMRIIQRSNHFLILDCFQNHIFIKIETAMKVEMRTEIDEVTGQAVEVPYEYPCVTAAVISPSSTTQIHDKDVVLETVENQSYAPDGSDKLPDGI